MEEGIHNTYLPSRGGIFATADILLPSECQRVAKEAAHFLSLCLGDGTHARGEASLSRYILATMADQAAQTRHGPMESRVFTNPVGTKPRFLPCEVRVETPGGGIYCYRFATTQGGPYLGEWRTFCRWTDSTTMVVESRLAQTFGPDWLQRAQNGERISLHVR